MVTDPKNPLFFRVADPKKKGAVTLWRPWQVSNRGLLVEVSARPMRARIEVEHHQAGARSIDRHSSSS